MVNMFWLSGTADRAITYIRSVELNGNREHEKISSYFSVYPRQRHFQSQCQWKSIQAKANTMVLDNKLFSNGFHSFENIFLLRNNLNVLKFKGNH